MTNMPTASRAAATTAAARPAARVVDLQKNYLLGRNVVVPALRGVTLEFAAGEFTAIMGASGSGKSTLLNLLGCLDRPSGGQYFLGDDDVSQLTDDQLSDIRCHRLGFIFQAYNLIPQLTVVENIELPLYYRGDNSRSSRDRCQRLAELVGLGHRLDHRPFQLSGGQQQRVAIARSLANDPRVVLADEPTGNLDSQTGEEILQILERLSSEGKTIIMVTHEPDVAARAHRTIRMRDGRVDSDVRNIEHPPVHDSPRG